MTRKDLLQLAISALMHHTQQTRPITATEIVLATFHEELAKPEPETALTTFYACEGDKEDSPLERLRFFCSLSMNGQDWLDSEPFFDALTKPEPEPAGYFLESLGNDYCKHRFEQFADQYANEEWVVPLYRKENTL